jgi:hypothetical protein
MRIAALLGGLLLLGCGPSLDNTHRPITVGEAVGGLLWCAAGSPCDPPKPPTVGVSLQGQVLQTTAVGTAPLPYARLLLQQNSRVVATAASDRHGYFRFYHLDRGDYELVLEPGDYSATEVVTVGLATAEVLLYASRQ